MSSTTTRPGRPDDQRQPDGEPGRCEQAEDGRGQGVAGQEGEDRGESLEPEDEACEHEPDLRTLLGRNPATRASNDVS